jgi:hypothetical protein
MTDDSGGGAPRTVRDEIEVRVRQLLDGLRPTAPS